MNDVSHVPALSGVPETLLWTLHNRASEAMRPDARLHDPDAVRLYHAIDYDYTRSFGPADGSHAVRSLVFDRMVRAWMARHLGGTVVELACGLETQFQRCDDGKVRWLCVDVAETIAVRDRLLPASGGCRHLACSALDLSWMNAVDADAGVMVTAQGLLMYFEEHDVQRLLQAIVARFPGVEIVFDTIPHWFSKRTLRGLDLTPFYRTPPMPWAIAAGAVAPTLRRWLPQVTRIEQQPYRGLRGVRGWLLPVLQRIPGVRDALPVMVRVRTD